MRQSIKTLLFGSPQDCRSVAQILASAIPTHIHEHQCFFVHDLEALEESLVTYHPTLILVLENGAAGMECVCRCQERKPNLPIFWFSDDRGFAVQSYRFNCAYFSTKPVTAEKLTNALRRCHHTGIQYTIERPM